MTTTRSLFSAALALCAVGTAHATTDYSAGLSVQGGLPKLVTGSPVHDGNAINGQWTTDGRPDTFARSRDFLGYVADPVTQQLSPEYSSWRGGDGGKHYGGPLNTMMEARSRNGLADNNSAEYAEVFWTFMSASAQVVDVSIAEVESRATWNRNFSIDPLTTFTFSVLSTMSIVGDAAPLATQSAFNFDLNASFASMTMADAAGRLRNTIGASISSVLPADLGGVFGYSFGPGGLMSLTVTNTTNAAMTGTLSAGSYVNLSAPVPEPQAVLSMLAGLALVGAMVRRRKQATLAA